MGGSLVNTRRPTRAVVAVLVSLIAVAALPVAASSQPAPGQQSAESPFFSAISFPVFLGSFSAVSDAGGANPSGQVSYFLGAGPTSGKNVSATVVCLSVSGNTAVIGFQGTSVRPLEPPVPVVGELVVADNGPADSLLDTVGLSERATGVTNCAAPGPVFGSGPVAGDVIVHPPAVPTSKDQCKNGGWRNFPGFKNQGDCVSFVATGGKNPPAGG
jgi:hypothetical protein